MAPRASAAALLPLAVACLFVSSAWARGPWGGMSGSLPPVRAPLLHAFDHHDQHHDALVKVLPAASGVFHHNGLAGHPLLRGLADMERAALRSALDRFGAHVFAQLARTRFDDFASGEGGAEDGLRAAVQQNFLDPAAQRVKAEVEKDMGQAKDLAVALMGSVDGPDAKKEFEQYEHQILEDVGELFHLHTVDELSQGALRLRDDAVGPFLRFASRAAEVGERDLKAALDDRLCGPNFFLGKLFQAIGQPEVQGEWCGELDGAVAEMFHAGSVREEVQGMKHFAEVTLQRPLCIERKFFKQAQEYVTKNVESYLAGIEAADFKAVGRFIGALTKGETHVSKTMYRDFVKIFGEEMAKQLSMRMGGMDLHRLAQVCEEGEGVVMEDNVGTATAEGDDFGPFVPVEEFKADQVAGDVEDEMPPVLTAEGEDEP